jgi:hypothetical protein
MGRSSWIGPFGALATVVLCLLAFPVSAGAAIRESSFVERATTTYRATVSCYDRPDWRALVVSGHPEFRGHENDVLGLWRYDIRQVALPARGCTALERWPQTPAATLSIWIFVLGHELTHVEQSDWYNAPWSRAFDENEANCGGLAKFERIRIALGITRRLKPPPRSLVGCPLRPVRPRR